MRTLSQHAWKRSYGYSLARAARSLSGHARFGEPEYQLLPQWLSPGDVALDAGANLGFYTFRIAGLVGGSGTVVACEPQRPLARRLKFSSSILRLSQVVIAPVALAANSGDLSFALPTTVDGEIDDGQAHMASLDEDDCFEASATTLDELWDSLGLKRLHFAKIDVEGMEMDVLRGGLKTIRDNKPLILCESQDIHASRYGYTVRDVFDLLRDLGYDAHVLQHNSLTRLSSPDEDFVNYIFLPQ